MPRIKAITVIPEQRDLCTGRRIVNVTMSDGQQLQCSEMDVIDCARFKQLCAEQLDPGACQLDYPSAECVDECWRQIVATIAHRDNPETFAPYKPCESSRPDSATTHGVQRSREKELRIRDEVIALNNAAPEE